MCIPSYLEPIVNSYFENDAKKLNKVVDKVLKRLRFETYDKEEYYSLATEIFVREIIPNYNPEKSFEKFLYSTLYKKFCTSMTSKTRFKRCMKIKVKEKDEYGNVIVKYSVVPDDRLNSPIGDDNGYTLEDTLKSDITVEKEVFEKEEIGYSDKMTRYLKRLSPLQKDVLRLISIGFKANDILDELHITQKQYNDCYAAIHSYRNTSILL